MGEGLEMRRVVEESGLRESLEKPSPVASAAAADLKVLIVGAGGIGCELIKNVALSAPFSRLTIVDLDNVDLSNLNRQFLFRREDIGKSKAAAAARAAKAYVRPLGARPLTIQTFSDRIQKLPIDQFVSHDLVLNALDNFEARRYVNRVCLAYDIPLIDSGSTGTSGQVVPLCPMAGSECYDCREQPIVKSFPVCTIRLTPEKPEHCIAWARFLYELIFFEPDTINSTATSDATSQSATGSGGTNQIATNANAEDSVGQERSDERNEERTAERIDGIKTDSTTSENVLADLKSELFTPRANGEALLKKLFIDDVATLIASGASFAMPPSPLPQSECAAAAEAFREGSMQQDVSAQGASGGPLQRQLLRVIDPAAQTKCDLKSVLVQFHVSFALLSARALALASTEERSTKERSTEESSKEESSNEENTSTIPGMGRPWLSAFDKDDDDIMAFVYAAAALRAAVYGIDFPSLWDCKSIAGAIQPTIAATNAIVAGAQFAMALKLAADRAQTRTLDQLNDQVGLRFVWVRDRPVSGRLLFCEELEKANKKCAVCQQDRVAVTLPRLHGWTLGKFCKDIVARAYVELQTQIEAKRDSSEHQDLSQSPPVNQDSKNDLDLSNLSLLHDSNLIFDADLFEDEDTGETDEAKLKELLDSSLESLNIGNGASISVSIAASSSFTLNLRIDARNPQFCSADTSTTPFVLQVKAASKHAAAPSVPVVQSELDAGVHMEKDMSGNEDEDDGVSEVGTSEAETKTTSPPPAMAVGKFSTESQHPLKRADPMQGSASDPSMAESWDGENRRAGPGDGGSGVEPPQKRKRCEEATV